MCNKISFETRQEALNYRQELLVTFRRSKNNHKDGDSPKKLKPYICPICSKYHLTKCRKRKEYKRWKNKSR